MSSSKDAHLYGAPRPRRPSTSKAITSSSTLAFSSALSSLISASSTPTTTTTNTANTIPARARSSTQKKKSDIFTTHNRNASKRAAADMLSSSSAFPTEQKHSTTSGAVDEDSWRRTKRKMEEKARLYAAMKRGDVEDEAEKVMVDFDRKWAEAEKARGGGSGGVADDDDDEDDNGDDAEEEEEEEKIQYTDEFGRTRHGTRAEAARSERQRLASLRTSTTAPTNDPSDRFTARPTAPTGIIYGDTIQSLAFQPDTQTSAQMDELASKRDREATPPDAVHYDASAEIRNRGTGFFKFSGEEEERRRQMEGLERERKETERVREAREGERERRRREVEERRRVIGERRGKVRAERFLEELGGEILGKQGDKGADGVEGEGG